MQKPGDKVNFFLTYTGQEKLYTCTCSCKYYITTDVVEGRPPNSTDVVYHCTKTKWDDKLATVNFPWFVSNLFLCTKLSAVCFVSWFFLTIALCVCVHTKKSEQINNLECMCLSTVTGFYLLGKQCNITDTVTEKGAEKSSYCSQ